MPPVVAGVTLHGSKQTKECWVWLRTVHSCNVLCVLWLSVNMPKKKQNSVCTKCCTDASCNMYYWSSKQWWTQSRRLSIYFLYAMRSFVLLLEKSIHSSWKEKKRQKKNTASTSAPHEAWWQHPDQRTLHRSRPEGLVEWAISQQDPKPAANAAWRLFKGDKDSVLRWPSQSLDLNPTQHLWQPWSTIRVSESPDVPQTLWSCGSWTEGKGH